MPCPVTSDVDLMIKCDRGMIRTIVLIYCIIAVLAIIAGWYLMVHPVTDSLAGKLITPAVTSLALPFIQQHVKRKNALTPLLLIQNRCLQYGPGDVACAQLKTLVDEELKRRINAANTN